MTGSQEELIISHNRLSASRGGGVPVAILLPGQLLGLRGRGGESDAGFSHRLCKGVHSGLPWVVAVCRARCVG